MPKPSHIIEAPVFAVTGGSFLLAAARFAWHLRTIEGPYFQSAMDLLEGIVFLLAAAGLYRRDLQVRKFAIVPAGLYVLVCGIGLMAEPGIVFGSGLLVWLIILLWLLSATARAQFTARESQTRVA